MKIKISEITTGLNFVNGIWYSKKNSKISYPEHGNEMCFEIEDKSYWFVHRNKVLEHIIQSYCDGKSFFDVGGGNGYVTKALQDLGIDAYLIEPGIQGIKNAENRGIKNLINSSLQDCNFKSRTICNIGLFDVLEHVEDDVSFLGIINKLLTVNGKVFISVPTYKLLWSEYDISSGHYRRYSAKSLSDLLRNCGFSIEYKSYFFSFLVPLIFLFRTIPWILFNNKIKRAPEIDHNVPSGIINKLIELLTQFELYIISRNMKIIIGSSCIIVAKKPGNDSF
jgi:hypothetical protein